MTPPDSLDSFLAEAKIQILNVAGPRASAQPGVTHFVIVTLDRAIKQDQQMASQHQGMER
jgi:hypothetical protein